MIKLNKNYYEQFLQLLRIIMIIIGTILTLALLLSTRDVDENGMDSYDRMWGIAREGYTRNQWGQIHRNGEYDFLGKSCRPQPLFQSLSISYIKI